MIDLTRRPVTIFCLTREKVKSEERESKHCFKRMFKQNSEFKLYRRHFISRRASVYETFELHAINSTL